MRKGRLLKDGTSVGKQVKARNKRSLALDLRTPEGQGIVRQLAHEADVLIENFRPGAMEGWGLSPDDLIAQNPKLIVLRISGYGQTGPYRNRPRVVPYTNSALPTNKVGYMTVVELCMRRRRI